MGTEVTCVTCGAPAGWSVTRKGSPRVVRLEGAETDWYAISDRHPKSPLPAAVAGAPAVKPMKLPGQINESEQGMVT